MQQVGDNQSGFHVEVDLAARAVRVTAWGFWAHETASVFVRTVMSECQACPGLALVVLDFTRFKPQRDEGQQAVGALFGTLARLNAVRVDLHVSDALTKLQLMRIVREQNAGALVRFVARASVG